ncbi:hypothetical protein NQ317_011573 [Molorchus minor]|uniref:Reverse transcriptase n=1 Tax=Molorchus minor TaxID=1323400 RepID=A0ABQ9ITT1_9CUCU|nr:hypothetical protein NQ317_011573 [Molorchus minor]
MNLYQNSKKTNRTFPPWYSSEIKNNIRCKEVAHKNYKKHKSDYYLEEFKNLRALIKVQVDTAYRDYVSAAEEEITRNPSKFWSFVQSKRGKSRIPGTVTMNNKSFDTPQTIVDGFASYFSSVYIDSDPGHTNNSLSYTTGMINITHISENDILQAIHKLKNKMTAGVDGVPSFVVKDCAAVLAFPLSIIFNLILKTQKFPHIWKITRICPILKSGHPSLINNYRAVAILCNFAKILELSDNIDDLGVYEPLNNKNATNEEDMPVTDACHTVLSDTTNAQINQPLNDQFENCTQHNSLTEGCSENMSHSWSTWNPAQLRRPVSKSLQGNRKRKLSKPEASEKVVMVASSKQKLLDLQYEALLVDMEFKKRDNELQLKKEKLN